MVPRSHAVIAEPPLPAARRTTVLLVLGLALLPCLAGLAPLLAQQPATGPPSGEPAAPPDEEITLVLEPGQRPALRLAFPSLTGRQALPPEAAAAAGELEATLRSDLDATGIFTVQGAEELAAAGVGDGVGLEIYRSLGNEILLRGELKLEDRRLVFEGRILDLKSGDQIVGKRYRGELDLARRIAHSFTDEVALYFTGRPGIALTSLAFYSDRDGFKEIYLMDYDGYDQRRVTGHSSTSLSPEWSPDSTGLAYVSYFGGAPGIYYLDLASGAKRPLITDGSFNGSPAFSPDGKRIAFTRSLAGNTEIFLAGLDGGDLRRLTHSPGIDTNPAWSPTGREIAFTSSRDGTPQIYIMDAEGSNLRRLSGDGEYNDGAAWHPSGDRIAYASRRGGRFEIVITSVVTGETRVLPLGAGSNEQPSFSPDGRKIAFTSDRTGTHQIFVADVDGGRVRQLTRDASSWAAAWSGYPR